MRNDQNKTKKERELTIKVAYHWVEVEDKQKESKVALKKVDLIIPTVQFFLVCPYCVRIITCWTIPKDIDSDPVEWWLQYVVKGMIFTRIPILTSPILTFFEDTIRDFAQSPLGTPVYGPYGEVYVTEVPHIERREESELGENSVHEMVTLAFSMKATVSTPYIGVQQIPELLRTFSYPFGDLVAKIGEKFQENLRKSLPSYLMKVTERSHDWNEKFKARGVDFSVSEVEVTVDTTQHAGTGASFVSTGDWFFTEDIHLSFHIPVPISYEKYFRGGKITSPEFLRLLSTVCYLYGYGTEVQSALLKLADLLELHEGRIELDDQVFYVNIKETHVAA